MFLRGAYAQQDQVERPVAVVLEVDGAIGPASAGYLTREVKEAAADGAELIIIRMDTPGGLTSSMRDIIDEILASPVPVVTWVGPSGARAASAGTYILYASHVAAMAPGTTLGAATPVRMGGRGGSEAGDDDAKTSKAVNDAAAYIRTLADLRGRNAEWGERAVREAATLTGDEAITQDVIDVMAADLETLIEKVDGRSVTVGTSEQTLIVAEVRLEERGPAWRDKLLSVITNPNVAFILMTLGFYGLIFEFANPGALVPGVLGGLCLLVGLYAVNVLPVNYAGLALIGLGLALMVAEAYAPSFGILGFGGLASFATGGLILFDTGSPAFGVSWWTVGVLTLLTGAVLIFLVGYMIRAQTRPLATGEQVLIGETAEVYDWNGETGRVRLQGELWNAAGPTGLLAGTYVRVKAVNGLTLDVVSRDDQQNISAQGQAGESQ
ncbi:nodulation protein NfeD [Henriciella sp.]|uniref:NfeD family protein n=1 Tax=Henriciella sp. TaxID=1968823 RepID=UPI0026063361|nr:nodulation protein NfeD [Henriciella sp.]